MMIDRKFAGEFIFNLVKLIRRGSTQIELIEKGYEQENLDKIQEMMNYLFVCWRNENE